MARIILELEANVPWHARRSSSSERWVGVCDAMNVSTEAESLDELHSVIDETMQLLLVDLLQDNELEQFLRDRGWRASNMPEAGSAEDVEFEVPWEVIVEGARGLQRQAH